MTRADTPLPDGPTRSDAEGCEDREGPVTREAHRHAAAAPREFPLSLHLRVIVQVLEELHYAHELRAYDGQPQALVHPDVSPQNVFVTYDGRVKALGLRHRESSQLPNRNRCWPDKG